MARFLFTMLPANDLGLPTRLIPIVSLLLAQEKSSCPSIPRMEKIRSMSPRSPPPCIRNDCFAGVVSGSALYGGLSTPILTRGRGEIGHKNFWLVNLETGAERQHSELPPNFDVRGDFDISSDGGQITLARGRELGNGSHRAGALTCKSTTPAVSARDG